MNSLDVIFALIMIEYIYHANTKMLGNFKNGCPLHDKSKDKYEKIRTFLSVIAIINAARILQIIFITSLFVCELGLYIYIGVQNKTLNKDNPDLQQLYIAEIKKQIKFDCIFAVIFIVTTIIFLSQKPALCGLLFGSREKPLWVFEGETIKVLSFSTV